ncbi:hypothetical protein LF41_1932 [Lysobacter dokdonensis DS-58]|uniref:Uncharacterized protein n=1 Tax=Lysobacter dokdonensis DS-58 TaxID=1300345 RepID=A0A0A2WHJ8_9GAMM|nr:hypothetical protein [Lysobacter dokdonensis]KGQ17725.1 hypothetical protein LF41_1932 [Lysobacter dokdonensis DS-58]
MSRVRLVPLLFLALNIAACGDQPEGVARRADGSAMDPLPAPEGARGSITGMPAAPGPGQPEDNASIAAEEDIAIDESALGENDNPEVALDAEPTSNDAVQAIQRYYDAIRSQDFAGAYALWSDGGRASGQTPEQFAAGFADTADVVVTLDAPARMEGAMGSRYIEVPVAVEATTRDGSVRRFVGAYTLRRSVVDGATPEQRAWRIASADLRELTQ